MGSFGKGLVLLIATFAKLDDVSAGSTSLPAETCDAIDLSSAGEILLQLARGVDVYRASRNGLISAQTVLPVGDGLISEQAATPSSLPSLLATGASTEVKKLTAARQKPDVFEDYTWRSRLVFSAVALLFSSSCIYYATAATEVAAADESRREESRSQDYGKANFKAARKARKDEDRLAKLEAERQALLSRISAIEGAEIAAEPAETPLAEAPLADEAASGSMDCAGPAAKMPAATEPSSSSNAGTSAASSILPSALFFRAPENHSELQKAPVEAPVLASALQRADHAGAVADETVRKRFFEAVYLVGPVVSKAGKLKRAAEANVGKAIAEVKSLAIGSAAGVADKVFEVLEVDLRSKDFLMLRAILQGEVSVVDIDITDSEAPPLPLLLAGLLAPFRLLLVAGWNRVMLTLTVPILLLLVGVMAFDIGRHCGSGKEWGVIWLWSLGMLSILACIVIARLAMISKSVHALRRLDCHERTPLQWDTDNENFLVTLKNWVVENIGDIFKAMVLFEDVSNSSASRSLNFLNIAYVLWGGFGVYWSAWYIEQDSTDCNALALRFVTHMFAFMTVLLLSFTVPVLMLWVLGALLECSAIELAILQAAKAFDDANVFGLPCTSLFVRALMLGSSAAQYDAEIDHESATVDEMQYQRSELQRKAQKIQYELESKEAKLKAIVGDPPKALKEEAKIEAAELAEGTKVAAEQLALSTLERIKALGIDPQIIIEQMREAKVSEAIAAAAENAATMSADLVEQAQHIEVSDVRDAAIRAAENARAIGADVAEQAQQIDASDVYSASMRAADSARAIGANVAEQAQHIEVSDVRDAAIRAAESAREIGANVAEQAQQIDASDVYNASVRAADSARAIGANAMEQMQHMDSSDALNAATRAVASAQEIGGSIVEQAQHVSSSDVWEAAGTAAANARAMGADFVERAQYPEDWKLDNTALLCKSGEEACFHGKAKLLSDFTSVSEVVTKLNEEPNLCPEGFCVVHSTQQGKYFVVYKADKKTEVFRLFNLNEEWKLDNAVLLCKSGEEACFHGKAKLLSDFTSVSEAIRKLNEEPNLCPEGFCVVHSTQQGKHYVVYKADKKTEVFRLFNLKATSSVE